MSKKTHVPDDRPNQGLSRRDLFRAAGLATGGAMLLGLPTVLSSLTTTAEAASPDPVLTMALELEKQFAGFLSDVSGGSAFADIVLEPQGKDLFQRKRPGPVRYEDIVLDIKLEHVRAPLLSWITDSLPKSPVLKNGAIMYRSTLGGETIMKLSFFNAMLSEMQIHQRFDPIFEVGQPGDVTLRLRITPQSVLLNTGENISQLGSMRSPTRFIFNVQGLESTAKHIQRVEGIGAKRIAAQTFDCSVVHIALPAQHAYPYYKWFEEMVIKGNFNAQRAGQLEWRTNDNIHCGGVKFGGLGIVRYSLGNENNIPMAYIDMYCETINFTLPM